MGRCLICGMTAELEYGTCPHCKNMEWGGCVQVLQLRRIADALENIEKKMKDGNKW